MVGTTYVTGDSPPDELPHTLGEIAKIQQELTSLEADISGVFERVVGEIRQMVNADGVILKLSDESGVMTRQIVAGISPVAGGGANGGMGSSAEVSLVVGGRVIGKLQAVARQPDVFAGERELALRVAAGLIATAILHAEELAARKQLLASRTEAVNSLRESEVSFRTAFEHAAIGKALVGLDGKFLQVNRAICQILGYDEADLLRSDFQSLTYHKDLDGDLSYLRQLIEGKIPSYHMVKRYLHRDGHLVWAQLSVSVVREGGTSRGRPLYFISQVQDISQRVAAEDALRASEAEYRATFEAAGVGKAQVDLATGRLKRVNSKLASMLGYTTDELLKMHAWDLCMGSDMEASRRSIALMYRGEVSEMTVERRYRCKDGRSICAEVNVAAIKDGNGKPFRSAVTVHDISDRKRAVELESRRRAVLELVARDGALVDISREIARIVEVSVAHGQVAIFALQAGQLLLHVQTHQPEFAAAVEKLPKTAVAAALAATVQRGLSTCGAMALEEHALFAPLVEVGRKVGLSTCWTIPIVASDGSSLGLLAVFFPERREPDASERAALESAAALATIALEHHQTLRQLSHLVGHDRLTGLPNRILLADRLEHALSLAARSAAKVGLLALDLDGFKQINDTLGHPVGDALLQQFANRLLPLLRTSDTMARIGGDEFLVVLPDLTSRADATAVATKLLAALEEPLQVGTHAIPVSTSIGIALADPANDPTDSARLQQQADAALYQAKAAGKRRYAI